MYSINILADIDEETYISSTGTTDELIDILYDSLEDVGLMNIGLSLRKIEDDGSEGLAIQ